MSINLVQAVNSAFSENIAEQLSQQFGIPAQIIRQVAARIAPGLVASLMDRATLAPGSRSVHSVIMLPDTDAHIADQFSRQIATTGGLKQLETNGHSLAALATGRRIDALTDTVSAETGVPTQATSALAGIVAALLFGMLKRHFLLAQWKGSHLPRLLREQVAEINASMSNAVASSIGVGNTEGFTSCISSRLEAVASNLADRENSDATIAAEPVMPAATQVAPAAKPEQSSPAPLRPPVRKRAPKRSNKWVWLLFALLAAILAAVYYRGFTQGGAIDMSAAPATQPVQSIEQPASAAASLDTQPVEAAPVAASTTAVASEPVVTAAPQPASATQASTAEPKDAQLLFNVNQAGVPTIEATVGTETEKTQLVDALAHRFRKSYTANVSVVPETRPATWLSHLNDFAALISLPGAEAKLTGTKVELSGTAADAKLGWDERLKNALGGTFQITSLDADSTVVQHQAVVSQHAAIPARR
jgi:hypothetical protein